MIISASKLVLAMSHIYKCYEIKITPRIEFSYKKFPKIPVALFWLFNYREFSYLAVHWLSVTSLFNFSSHIFTLTLSFMCELDLINELQPHTKN